MKLKNIDIDESMLNEFLGTKSKDSTQKEKGGFKIP